MTIYAPVGTPLSKLRTFGKQYLFEHPRVASVEVILHVCRVRLRCYVHRGMP